MGMFIKVRQWSQRQKNLKQVIYPWIKVHTKKIYIKKKKGNHEDSQFPCVDLTGKQIES